MNELIIYTSNSCANCTIMKLYLDSKDIKYTIKNISENKEYKKEIISKGFLGVPVLIYNNSSIVGYNKNKLDIFLVENGIIDGSTIDNGEENIV